METPVFYIDNDTIFQGTITNEKRKFCFESNKIQARIHYPNYINPNTGEILSSLQSFSEIWISDDDIFTTFSQAKEELNKRKTKTKIEDIFNIFKKNHYHVFFYLQPKRYKGILSKEYFFNDIDNLFYFKVTDIFEIKFFNDCTMLPTSFKSVYLPETKLYNSMLEMRKKYEENLKESSSKSEELSSFIGLFKEERYDDNTGIY